MSSGTQLSDAPEGPPAAAPRGGRRPKRSHEMSEAMMGEVLSTIGSTLLDVGAQFAELSERVVAEDAATAAQPPPPKPAKEKKEKKEKGPKRPPTMYNQYIAISLPIYKSSHAGASHTEAFAAVAAQWKDDKATWVPPDAAGGAVAPPKANKVQKEKKSKSAKKVCACLLCLLCLLRLLRLLCQLPNADVPIRAGEEGQEEQAVSAGVLSVLL